MANKGRSEKGFFGTVNHYDARGKKVGRSEPGFFGLNRLLVRAFQNAREQPIILQQKEKLPKAVAFGR